VGYYIPMHTSNPAKTKSHRRALRKEMTRYEQKLWRYMQNKALGVKVRRQHGVGPYILDFYIASARLAIELDGGHHGEDAQFLYDQHRDRYLAAQDILVLRFDNAEIWENIDNVIILIEDVMQERLQSRTCTPPQSSPT
jgi:very-short-patch-repair endonuclease